MTPFLFRSVIFYRASFCQHCPNVSPQPPLVVARRHSTLLSSPYCERGALPWGAGEDPRGPRVSCFLLTLVQREDSMEDSSLFGSGENVPHFFHCLSPPTAVLFGTTVTRHSVLPPAPGPPRGDTVGCKAPGPGPGPEIATAPAFPRAPGPVCSFSEVSCSPELCSCCPGPTGCFEFPKPASVYAL